MNAPLFVIFSKLIQRDYKILDKYTNLVYNKTIEYEQIIQPLQRVIGARAVAQVRSCDEKDEIHV